MSKYVERVSNLIRVVSAAARFDIRYWWNPTLQCGCAIGYAQRDEYFIKNGLGRITDMRPVSEFFNISSERATELFVGRVDYGSRTDVLSSLRVLLMEKQAEEVASDAHSTVEFLAEDVREDIAAW